MSTTSAAARAATPERLRGRRRGRPPLLVAMAIVIVGAVIACAIFGELLAPADPSAQNLIDGLQEPSSAHWLGTDESGRDMLSRVVVGARHALVGPLLIAAGAALIGTVLGLAAGYIGGWLDALIMRAVDLAYALPALLVAIVLIGVVGGGYFSAVAILVLLTAPLDTRIIRGATLEQRALPYVDAARTLGLSRRRIMLRHIWPNVLPLIVANAFLNVATGLVALAALSFLGIGADVGSPDWGRMLSENLGLIQEHPAIAITPGIALIVTAVALNTLGDWCYELLADRGRAR